MYTYECVYIHIYIYREREREICIHIQGINAVVYEHLQVPTSDWHALSTPNLPTNTVGFGGFDSSIILILRGGILMPIGIS